MFIGKAYSENANRLFKGRIKNIKIYNRALSEKEIQINNKIDDFRFSLK